MDTFGFLQVDALWNDYNFRMQNRQTVDFKGVTVY